MTNSLTNTVINITNTSVIITGLIPGQYYDINITAVNSIGPGSCTYNKWWVSFYSMLTFINLNFQQQHKIWGQLIKNILTTQNINFDNINNSLYSCNTLLLTELITDYCDLVII